MSEYNAYPLSWPVGWPRTSRDKRQSASFSTRSRSTNGGWASTVPISVASATSRLMKEIKAFTRNGRQWRIDPDRVVLSSNIPLRRDGLPRSDGKEPEDSGVAVYFTIDENATVLACDKWWRVADNIAAVAAHIGALRGQERWGVGSTKQAFAGYMRLEEKTEESCWEVLGIRSMAGETGSTNKLVAESVIMKAYRSRANETHPDKLGGSPEAFDQVVKAKDMALQLIK